MTRMLLTIPLLAQAAGEIDELKITPGTIAGGCLFLCALGGSVATIARWRSRWTAGQPVIPKAARHRLTIPTPIMGLGLLIAGFMAVTVILFTMGAQDMNGQLPAAAEQAEPPGENDPAENAPEKEAFSADRLVTKLVQTVYFDLALLALLGIPIILLRARQREKREYDAFNAQIPTMTTDHTPPATKHDISTAFAASTEPNPYLIGTAGVAVDPPAVETDPATPEYDSEPWHLGRELRYAAETCLVAWLPTAILRIILVVLLQDEAQHPFLEMLTHGVPVTVMLLIAVTAVILAPLVEELLYRVIILGGLLSHTSSIVALSISSVLFAFAHGFPDSVALLPLAFAIGWTYQQRRSYRTVVLVHFLFNGFNILLAGMSLL